MINAYIGIDNTNSIIPTFANILLGFHGLDNLILGGKWMSRNVVCLYTNFDKDNRSLYLWNSLSNSNFDNFYNFCIYVEWERN